MIVQAARTRLLAVTALTALVGPRVYTLTFPEHGIWPAVRLQQIGEVQVMHLRGTSGLVSARLQVDAVADAASPDPYASADAVSLAAHGDLVAGVATGLVGFAGTVGSVVIVGILPLDRREVYDPEERRQVMVSRDYWVTVQG